MKKLIFIFCTLAFIACDDDDNLLNHNDSNLGNANPNPIYNSATAISDQNIFRTELPEYPFVTNGDTIQSLSGTDTEKLKYEIIEETVPGAVKIDSETGVITIKDAKLFVSDENLSIPKVMITVKITAGDKFSTQKYYFSVFDVENCAGSNYFYHYKLSKVKQLTEYDFKVVKIEEAEFTFILPEKKNLCTYPFYFITDDEVGQKVSATFILSDETGTEIFNKKINTVSESGPFWNLYIFDIKDLNVTLHPNKKYTYKQVFTGGPGTYLLIPSSDSKLNLPFDLGHFKIIETSVVFGSKEYHNYGFLEMMDMGFE